jgi:hypothetical protein
MTNYEIITDFLGSEILKEPTTTGKYGGFR